MRRARTTALLAWLMLAVFARVAGGGTLSVAQRLEAAEAAYTSAMEQLRAAEAELAAAREAAALELGVRGQPAAGAGVVTAGTAGSRTPDSAPEPADEPGFFAWKSWKKSLTFGVNGSNGNSDYLSGNAKLTLDRDGSEMKTHLDAVYRNARRNDENTENRLRINLQNDWMPNAWDKWRVWAKGAYEYDEFQNWDHRVSAHAGLGYDFVKNPDTTLVWRGGLGGTQAFNGSNDDFRPEALLTGLDYVHQIKDNQKFTAGTELFFDISDTREYRINTGVDWEITLDKESGLLLRTGVDHRYDSNPGGTAESSDLDYSMSLGWRF
jgi:putative salt-induced outer membrane protein YdiY